MSLKGFGSNKVMRIGQANIDFDALTIHGPEGQFSMESKVMRVLEVLVENAGQVLTRSDLIEAVWGVEYGGDERLSRAISLLRKALGDSRSKAEYIETIPRRGYRFIAKVETETDAEGAADSDVETTQIDVPATEEIVKAESVSITNAPVEPKLPSEYIAAETSSKRRRPLFLIAASLLIVACFTFLFPRLDTPLNPNSTSAKMEQGFENLKFYSRSNAIRDAHDIFSEILAKDPDNAAARAGLSLALMRQYTNNESDPALLRRAKSAAEAALRSDAHLGLGHVALGWAKGFDGDFDGALRAYDQASILDPENMYLLEGLARTKNKLGLGNEAKDILDQAVSLYPDAPIFYSYSGQFFEASNDYRNAERIYRTMLDLSNENHIAYAQLAHALHFQDRTSEAIQILQDGLQIDKSALLYSNLGTYLFFQGQYELAADAFEKTLELDGNTHKYLYWANLADAYRFVPNRRKESIAAYDQAISLLQNELTVSPRDTTLISRLALYKAKRGNLDEARTLIEQISSEAGQSASLYYRQLVIFELLSERDNALLMLKNALESRYPLIEIKNDPELKNLRQDTNYHLLLAQEGAKNDDAK